MTEVIGAMVALWLLLGPAGEIILAAPRETVYFLLAILEG